MKVIYVERKQGEYQGHAYDTYIIHGVEPAVNKDNAKGAKCEIIKLKAKEVGNMNPMLWLDKNVEVLYDKYTRPVSIKVE